MRRWILCGLLCFPFIASAGLSPPTHEYRLKNGLKLIVREDHRAPIVLASIWYKVGGSYEHSGITGISHMLEHMMFRGTKRYGPGVLTKIITDRGGQQNAMTSGDFTAYYQLWAKQYLPLSFKLEADRMQHLVLSQALYDKEHQVVMEERRMRVDDNPQGLTLERFNAAAHVNNPYHHPTVGWMTDVKHLTLKNLKQWYHTWYVPNNAIVVVVGDVKPRAVYHLAQRYFGKIPARPVPAMKPREEVKGLGLRHLVVHTPAKLPWLILGYTVPELGSIAQKKSWQPFALDVLSGVLSAGESARLNRDLVRGQQLAVSASASYGLLRLHDDVFTLSGIPAKGHTIKALRGAFEREVKRLQTQPVSMAELNRVKAQVVAGRIYQRDSLMYQMYDLGVPEAIGISWKVIDNYVHKIDAVTPAQLQAVAKQYLTTRRETVAVLKPVAIQGGA